MGVASRQLVFVALVLVCGNFAQANEVSREDAELDPPMKVMLEAPESTLFRDCIAAAYTVTGTFFTMETPNNAEYQRYIPDESMRLNLVWYTVTQPISDITDCAMACDSTNGCYMFKYDGTHCKVTLNNAYDLSIEPMCEIGVDTEAVFVLTTASDILPCPFPTFSVATNKLTCAGVAIGDVVSVNDADALCSATYASGKTYDKEHDMTTVQIQDHLETLGYTQDLLIDATWISSMWKYTESSASIGSSAQMDAGLPNGGTGSSDYVKLYMKADNNFKLHAAITATTIPGALCTFPAP